MHKTLCACLITTTIAAIAAPSLEQASMPSRSETTQRLLNLHPEIYNYCHKFRGGAHLFDSHSFYTQFKDALMIYSFIHYPKGDHTQQEIATAFVQDLTPIFYKKIDEWYNTNPKQKCLDRRSLTQRREDAKKSANHILSWTLKKGI